MSALGMMFMASANDLLSLFVTLEFATFGFYVLVSYLRDDIASNEAGLKFFILGVFAAGLLAYGISLVFGETGQAGLFGHERSHSDDRIGHRISCSFLPHSDSKSAQFRFIPGFRTPTRAPPLR